MTQTLGFVSVGASSLGSAIVNIGVAQNGGILTTGGGGMAINPNGSVVVGNNGGNAGTLAVNGALNITGGGFGSGLTVGPSGTLIIGSGGSVNIQSGGQAVFQGFYTTSTNTVYNITNPGSTMTATGSISIDGATVNVISNGSLSALNLNIADQGASGTLTVDNSFAMAKTQVSNWGLQGGLAVATSATVQPARLPAASTWPSVNTTAWRI